METPMLQTHAEQRAPDNPLPVGADNYGELQVNLRRSSEREGSR